MPTGRERDDAIRRAEERIRHRRDSQSTREGRGRPDPTLFRHSGLIRPGDPVPGDSGRPVDVNVVGDSTVMSAMQVLSGGAGRGPGEPHHGLHTTGPHRFGANITSGTAEAEAARQITHEMRLQVEAAQQLSKASRDHLDTMRKVYDQERDAIEELTEIVRQVARDRTGVPAGTGAPVSAPGSPSSPGRGTTPGGPRSSGHGAAGGSHGHRMTGREHYDPAGLLGDGPIHGGRRNSQLDLMSHIAAGGDPSTFDPSAYMTPGRNHPTSYGELGRNMRVRVARQLNNRFGENSIPTLTPQYDDQGNLDHYLHDARDGMGPQRVEVGAQADGIAHSIATGFTGARMVGRMSGAMAQGGVGAALRAVPAVGWAVTAAEGANRVAEWVTEQRAANAPYQAIEGGTNFSTGFSERLAKLGTRLGERFTGGMTGDQSDRLFDTLTAQGFTGDRRSSYIDVASQNYKQYGMDPSETAKLITVAARTANSGLVNMAESIKTVTNTAIQYGQSAQVAREQFAANVEQLASSGMKGSALFSTAAADTAAVTEMGRSMQGVSFSGMNNEMVNRLEASSMGMSYGRFMARREDDPGLGMRAQDSLVGRVSRPYTTGSVGSAFQRKVDQYGGRDAVAKNPDLQRKIVKEVEDETNVDFSGYARTLSQYGVQGVDPNDPTSAGVVAMQETVHGGQWFAQKEKEAEAQHNQRDIRPEDKQNLNTDSRSAWQTFGDHLKSWWNNPLGVVPEKTNEMTNKEEEQKSGKIDQTIDQLLDPSKGISGNADVGVKVKTKEGEKVVPMNTALTKYRDQVAKGTAVIVGGDNDGKSVKDVTGGSEGNYQGPDTTGTDASGDAVDEDKWKKDHPTKSSDGDTSGSDVKVTVVPDQKLLGWLKFNTGNGAATEGAAANGSPTQPGGLPNGGSGTP